VLLRTTGYVDETTYMERIDRLAPSSSARRGSPIAMSCSMIRASARVRPLRAVERVGTLLAAALAR
jgi:hypothetical protein